MKFDKKKLIIIVIISAIVIFSIFFILYKSPKVNIIKNADEKEVAILEDNNIGLNDVNITNEYIEDNSIENNTTITEENNTSDTNEELKKQKSTNNSENKNNTNKSKESNSKSTAKNANKTKSSKKSTTKSKSSSSKTQKETKNDNNEDGEYVKAVVTRKVRNTKMENTIINAINSKIKTVTSEKLKEYNEEFNTNKTLGKATANKKAKTLGSKYFTFRNVAQIQNMVSQGDTIGWAINTYYVYCEDVYMKNTTGGSEYLLHTDCYVYDVNTGHSY